MKHPKVTIYTDGSWKGSYKTGGYAALVIDEYGNWRLIGDGMVKTTISRMELSGMLAALSILNAGCDVTIISDSMYAVNVVNKWAKIWEKNNYVKTDGDPVANTDIISLLMYHVRRMRKCKAIHVKSHTGYNDEQSMGNDICDYFAVHQSELAYIANGGTICPAY